jgi:hypothetical protein
VLAHLRGNFALLRAEFAHPRALFACRPPINACRRAEKTFRRGGITSFEPGIDHRRLAEMPWRGGADGVACRAGAGGGFIG